MMHMANLGYITYWYLLSNLMCAEKREKIF